jgi:hypothetical protein
MSEDEELQAIAAIISNPNANAFDRHSDLCAACAGRDVTPVATVQPHDQVSDCVTSTGRGAASQVGVNTVIGYDSIESVSPSKFRSPSRIEHHPRTPTQK